MSTLPLNIAAHQTDWEYRITLLLWTCCALSIAFIIVVPTIPAIVFLVAVLLYCVLFPVRPYQALTWSLVPWVIVLFGALSIIWSEQPMQSLRGAAQIALSVLAALMFAHGCAPDHSLPSPCSRLSLQTWSISSCRPFSAPRTWWLSHSPLSHCRAFG